MKRLLPTLGLGVVLLSGCGSGATDVGEISADQVRDDLLETLNGTHAFNLEFGDESPWPCPGGGDVRPSLQYGYAESPPGIIVEGTLGYEACTGTSTNGREIHRVRHGDDLPRLSYRCARSGRGRCRQRLGRHLMAHGDQIRMMPSEPRARGNQRQHPRLGHRLRWRNRSDVPLTEGAQPSGGVARRLSISWMRSAASAMPKSMPPAGSMRV